MTPSPTKPILFSGPMVRAILEDRKTQTRRVLKPQPPDGARYTGIHYASYEPDSWFFNSPTGPHKVRAVYAPGDLLWVRETWQGINTEDGPQLTYRATPDYFDIDAWDGPDEGAGPSFNYDRFPGTDFCNWGADVLNDDGPWRPSIFMPRWASRLTLEVTDVRVERLRDISEADAEAEGVTKVKDHCYVVRGFGYDESGLCHSRPTIPFAQLWDSLNAARGFGWDVNPWVVAITFKVHKANVDTLLAQLEAA